MAEILDGIHIGLILDGLLREGFKDDFLLR